MSGHYETVRLLLETGASLKNTRRRVKISRQFGEHSMIFDAFQIAKEKGHASIYALLEETRELRYLLRTSEKKTDNMSITSQHTNSFFNTRI